MRLAITTAGLAAALLAAPAAAPAAVTCDYSSAGKLLTVSLSAAGDNAQLAVVGAEITVGQGITPVACTGPGGPPTVTNTGAISVTGNAVNQFVVIHGADDFVPGPDPQDGSDDSGGSKEIEIFVNLNGAIGSTLIVDPGDDGGQLVFGTNGINPNAAGETEPRDADIIPNNVPIIVGFGGNGDDALSAQGGMGTGGPRTEGISLSGREGSDVLTGGDGPDSIRGGPGHDLLFGMGGDDSIASDAGDDTANAGAGTDTVVVAPFPFGTVSLDLAITARQDTGDGSDSFSDFENATSGEGSQATLRGDDGPNTLTSGLANDTLEGRGGVDVLNAHEGADNLDVRDGGPDTADCGPGNDTVIADAPGIDTLIGCENILFPVIAPSPTGGGGPAGSCDGETATITGTDASETIRGTSARDVIDARGGNDRVKGLGGNDVICGGSGKDRLDGGKGKDRLFGGTGNDKLLGGRGKDKLAGASGNDELSGGLGNDRLLGGKGRDKLFGGGGLDVLLGGPGRDSQQQ